MSETVAPAQGAAKEIKALGRWVIRFAGDSGNGMQLTGEQFTTESAVAGNDIATLPNFPAEIRAPAGTLFGVSSFQLQFGSTRVYTPGDRLDCLVAMNPAALKVHLRDLKTGGLLIVNTQAFDKRNLDKAGYAANPPDEPAPRGGPSRRRLNSQGFGSSPAPPQPPPPATSFTSWPCTSASVCGRSRPRTRSPPSPRRLAPRSAARSASPPRAVRGSR